jgi:SAM-dependent methyltransferase
MSADKIQYLERIRVEELAGIASALPKTSQLLDFGAGPGFQALRFRELGFSVSAIDLPPGESAPRSVFPVIAYDGGRLPYPDRCFDVVFSSNVLEHVKDLAATMHELARVLRANGVMIHVLPTSSWRWWTTIAEFIVVPVKVWRSFFLSPAELRLGHVLPRGLAAIAEAFGQLIRPLFFKRHGETGNAITELYRFSPHAWRRTFRILGFEVQRVESSDLFYTGEIVLGSRLSMRMRRRLSGYLGSSTLIWYLVSRDAHTTEVPGL